MKTKNELHDKAIKGVLTEQDIAKYLNTPSKNISDTTDKFKKICDELKQKDMNSL